MSERIYSARPINTYTGAGGEVGDAYVAFLKEPFPGAVIVDPGERNGEIKRRAAELKEEQMVDPKTGERSEQYYNEHGSKVVMAYFTEEVVGPCTVGTGLMLPVAMQNGDCEDALTAGVAAEMKQMYDLGRPTWLVSCYWEEDEPVFSMFRVRRIVEDTERGLDPVSKNPLYNFETDGGLFSMLSVDETRARMYTPRPDGTWDRDNLQPYFLPD